MNKEHVQPKPASMMERELSPETLATIKAIVKEDPISNSGHSGSLHIPSRVRPIRQAHQIVQDEPKRGRSVKPTVTKDRKPRRKAVPKRVNTSFLKSMITPRRLAVLAVIATFIINPWFLPMLFAVTAFVLTFFALLLGPDRVRQMGEAGWSRFERRKPEKAAALRRKANARLEKMQAKLEKLPASWTRGLHLPQLQNNDAAQTAAQQAYEHRMSQMARDNVQQRFS